MDLAFITPTAYLKKYATQGDIYLALAHLIDDRAENDYSRFHRREVLKGRRVILDNGLFEGAQVSPETLIHRAKLIGAQVVCAPDVLFDSQGTIKEFKRFIKLKQDFGLVAEIMGIPQARTPDEWWECFRFFDLSKHCSLIGLSILSIPESFGSITGKPFKRTITDSRMYLIKQLLAYKNLIGRPITQCHLLGLGESLADIVLAKRILPEIISNDSSSMFVNGCRALKYNRLGDMPQGKIKEKLNFHLKPENLHYQTEYNIDSAIQHNINVAKEIAHYNWTPSYAK